MDNSMERVVPDADASSVDDVTAPRGEVSGSLSRDAPSIISAETLPQRERGGRGRRIDRTEPEAQPHTDIDVEAAKAVAAMALRPRMQGALAAALAPLPAAAGMPKPPEQIDEHTPSTHTANKPPVPTTGTLEEGVSSSIMQVEAAVLAALNPGASGDSTRLTSATVAAGTVDLAALAPSAAAAAAAAALGSTKLATEAAARQKPTGPSGKAAAATSAIEAAKETTPGAASTPPRRRRDPPPVRAPAAGSRGGRSFTGTDRRRDVAPQAGAPPRSPQPPHLPNGTGHPSEATAAASAAAATAAGFVPASQHEALLLDHSRLLADREVLTMEVRRLEAQVAHLKAQQGLLQGELARLAQQNSSLNWSLASVETTCESQAGLMGILSEAVRSTVLVDEHGAPPRGAQGAEGGASAMTPPVPAAPVPGAQGTKDGPVAPSEGEGKGGSNGVKGADERAPVVVAAAEGPGEAAEGQ